MAKGFGQTVLHPLGHIFLTADLAQEDGASDLLYIFVPTVFSFLSQANTPENPTGDSIQALDSRKCWRFCPFFFLAHLSLELNAGPRHIFFYLIFLNLR